MKTLAALLALATTPAAADTVMADFFYDIVGTKKETVASRLVLDLNADGTIAASLTGVDAKINGFGIDTSSTLTHFGFSTGSTPGTMDVGMYGGRFSSAWNTAAKLPALSWTMSRVGGFTSVTQTYAGTGSPLFDFFLWDDSYNIWYANAGEVAAPPPSAVPVPAALPMLAAGLAALGLLRRRKR